MKWFAGTLGGVFLGFIILAVFVSFRIGAFMSVELSEGAYGPFLMIYKERIGPYHESSKTLIEIENLLKKYNITCPRTFGHYHDNPEKVDHERLRSSLGCVFEPEKKEYLKDLIHRNTELQSLKLAYYDQTKYLQGRFEGSPALVAIKVYPRLKKLSEKKRILVSEDSLEIYEIKSEKKVITHVLFKIIND